MLRETLLNAKTSTKLYTLFGCIIALFVGAVFLVFLPYYEADLLKGRRSSLADTVDIAYNLVVEYEARVQKGEFSEDEAKKRAATRLRNMHNQYPAGKAVTVLVKAVDGDRVSLALPHVQQDADAEETPDPALFAKAPGAQSLGGLDSLVDFSKLKLD